MYQYVKQQQKNEIKKKDLFFLSLASVCFCVWCLAWNPIKYFVQILNPLHFQDA